jgi:predicted nuclease of predicted toxin-antitoxin system
VRFVVDAQLPPRLARWLGDGGHEAVHVQDLPGGLTLPDAALWDFARCEQRVVISKDKDFLDLAAVRGTPPKVMVIGLGNASTSALLSALEEALPLLIAQLERPEVGVAILGPGRIEVIHGDHE